MDSDLRHRQQQMNSGLMRYKTAPSSYFAGLNNSGVGGGGAIFDEFLNPRPSTPETDRIFARFMSSGGTEDSSSHNLCDIGQNSSANEALQSQFVTSMKHETDIFQHHHHDQQQQQNNGYSSVSQMIYQNQSQPSLPNHNSAASNSGTDNSYRVVGSMAVDRIPQMKTGGSGSNSNLIRHSSSPAGLFSYINVENGYDIMKGMGNFGADNGADVEASFSGRMTPISEDGSKNMGMSDPEDESFSEEGHGNNRDYITGFPIGSWDDSAILSDSFPKRLEDDKKTFSCVNALDIQNAEGGNRPPTVLSHHLSLPKSSAELAAMEKLFQFQDSVPCKIRAKRGCATHPRSIAERVRRTRISERMRKLQVLVPNMDKQTKTSDMLDLAADYIKDLQKHVKTLSDNRAKCTCSNKQKP